MILLLLMVAGRAREFPREMDGALRLAPSDIVAASFLKPGAVVRRRRRNRNNRSNRSNRNNHSRNRDRQRQRSDDDGDEPRRCSPQAAAAATGEGWDSNGRSSGARV